MFPSLVHLNKERPGMKYTKKATVYLAGKIGGLTLEQATVWRRTLKGTLKHLYNFIDPTDGLEKWVKPGEIIRTDAAPDYDQIFERDMANVFKCNILVANLLANDNLFGTPFELGVAFAQNTPIIIATRFKHPFHDCAYKIVTSTHGIYNELLRHHENLSGISTDLAT